MMTTPASSRSRVAGAEIPGDDSVPATAGRLAGLQPAEIGPESLMRDVTALLMPARTLYKLAPGDRFTIIFGHALI